MLAAIEGAQRQILFETYIWKGDEVGERFKDALGRGGRPRRRGLLHLRRVREPRGLAAVQAVPADASRCCATPSTPPGWRFFDLRRYGRDHRKILVVDDEVGFVGGYNIGTAYATEWRDTHVRITGPGVWDLQAGLRRLLEPQPAPAVPAPASGRCCSRPPSTWEPRIRFHRNVPRLWMFPIRSMYLEAINRASRNIWMTHAYFIPDQDFVDALTARGAARGRRPPAAAGRSPTTSWPTGSRAATSASCSTPACGSSASATRWCTPRPATIDGTLVDGRHRQHRPAQPAPATTRSTSRSSTPALAEAMEEIFADRPVQLPRADQRRVGGARPPPQVHRVGARAAAPAAVGRRRRPSGH